jgi:hypothetical protein
MAEAERRSSRPFPGVQLEFGREGVVAVVSERIVVGRAPQGGPAAPLPVRSKGLGELQRILEAAALRHADLSRDVAERSWVLANLRRELRLAQLFMVRLVMFARIPRLVARGRASIEALAQVRAEREAGKVEVRFAVDSAAAAAYAALIRSFEDLARNDRIWDICDAAPGGDANWIPVAFSVGTSDIVACREEVLRAPRSGGGSLQILPGFVLLRGASETVVLEHDQVEFAATAVEFLVESDEVPRDAKVVSQSVAPEDDDEQLGDAEKAPRSVVEYGRMALMTHGGSPGAPTLQTPTYVLSSFAKARVFTEAYEDYKQSLAAVTEPAVLSTETRWQAGAAPEEPPLDVRPLRWLSLDWAAVVLLLLLLWLPFAMNRPAPSPASAFSFKPTALAVQTVAAPPTNAVIQAPIRASHKPKRAIVRSTQARAESVATCGLVREPTGVMKLVPCDQAGALTGPR